MPTTQFGRVLMPESRRTSDISLRELDNGKHTFRVIEGGDILTQVIWPTEVWSDENDRMEPSWRSVKLSQKSTDTVMDKLGALESEARQRIVDKMPDFFGGGIGDVVLSRNEARLYKVLYRGTVGNPYENPTLPIILECGSVVVARKLAQMNSERSKMSRRDTNTGEEVEISCWRNGPTYLYDIVIEKKPRAHSRFNVEYDVTPGRNDWYEKCSVSRWPNGAPPQDFDFVKEGVFTKEEYDNIMQSLIDLPVSVEADTEQTMMDMLAEFPINLRARNKNKQPFFPAMLAEEMRVMYREAGLPLIEDKGGTSTGVTAGGPSVGGGRVLPAAGETSQAQTAGQPIAEADGPTATENDPPADDSPESRKSAVYAEIQAVIDEQKIEYMLAVHEVAKRYNVDEAGVPDSILIAKIVEAKSTEIDREKAGDPPSPEYNEDDDLPF